MLLIFLLFCLVLNLFLMFLFFLASKIFKFNNMSISSFECGFTSYFYSRFSFSIHYYLIALIFLFLDLELCFVMPFFNEFLSILTFSFCFLILFILLMGLLMEWKQGKLDWIY